MYTNRYLEHLKNKDIQAKVNAAERVRQAGAQAAAEHARQEYLGLHPASEIVMSSVIMAEHDILGQRRLERKQDEDSRLETMRAMLNSPREYRFMRRMLTPEMFEARYPELCNKK